MYNKQKPYKTTIKGLNPRQGEPIEEKVRRITLNKEPITDTAPIIFTERKEGILPEHNIRTDRFDRALDAMDIVHKSHIAKREARHKTQEQKESEKRAKEAKDGMDKEAGNPEKN